MVNWKIFLLVLLMGFGKTSSAQYVNLYLTDSTSQSYALADISSITFSGSEMQMNFLGGSVLDWNTSIINYMDYQDSGLDIFEPTKDLLNEFLIYPNPSSGSVNISLNAETDQPIKVDIHDLQGRRIKELFQGKVQQSLNLIWTGENNTGHRAKPGVYFCTVSIGAQMISRTILLVGK